MLTRVTKTYILIAICSVILAAVGPKNADEAVLEAPSAITETEETAEDALEESTVEETESEAPEEEPEAEVTQYKKAPDT